VNVLVFGFQRLENLVSELFESNRLFAGKAGGGARLLMNKCRCRHDDLQSLSAQKSFEKKSAVCDVMIGW
jgi:hypothetical protein